jgi:hypothetical protein
MKISWTALLPILASRKLEQDDTGTHPRIKSEGKLFRIMLQATL